VLVSKMKLKRVLSSTQCGAYTSDCQAWTATEDGEVVACDLLRAKACVSVAPAKLVYDGVAEGEDVQSASSWLGAIRYWSIDLVLMGPPMFTDTMMMDPSTYAQCSTRTNLIILICLLFKPPSILLFTSRVRGTTGDHGACDVLRALISSSLLCVPTRLELGTSTSPVLLRWQCYLESMGAWND